MKNLFLALILIIISQINLFSQTDWIGIGDVVKTDKNVIISETPSDIDGIASSAKTSVITTRDRIGLVIRNNSDLQELTGMEPDDGLCFPKNYDEDIFALYSSSPLFGYAGYFDGKVGICGAQINFFDPSSGSIANDAKWRLIATSDKFNVLSGTLDGGRFILEKTTDFNTAFAQFLVDDKETQVAMEVTFDESGENEQLFQLRTNGFAYFPGKVIVGADSGTTPIPSINFFVNGTAGFGKVITSRLDVQDKIWAKSIQVKLPPFPDYVFEDDYKLMPLAELQKYIKQNGHLPNIPSAEEVEKKGSMDVGKFQTMQLEKIEELTLYILQLNEKIQKLEKALEDANQKK